MTTAAIASLDALKAVAATTGKQVFTILHTNDMHSNVIGLAPFTDYTPMRPNSSEAVTSRHVKMENRSGKEFQKNLLPTHVLAIL